MAIEKTNLDDVFCYGPEEQRILIESGKCPKCLRMNVTPEPKLEEVKTPAMWALFCHGCHETWVVAFSVGHGPVAE